MLYEKTKEPAMLLFLALALIILLNPAIVLSQSLSNILTWTTSSAQDLDKFRIYRGTGSNSYTPGSPFKTVTAGTTSYVDSEIQPDITYYYVVTALSIYGMESSFSNEVSISKSDSSEDQPLLTTGTVTPSSGSAKTDFTYTVHFSDPGGQVPTLTRVYIDDQPFTMTLSSGSANEGDYTFVKKLGKSAHSYYFFFTDSSMNEVRYPPTGSNTGPTVDSSKPDKPKNIRYKNK